MLEYAANDVIYLPKIYNAIKETCCGDAIDRIIEECNKYLCYSKINLGIKNFNKFNLEADTEIKGLVK